MLTFICIASLWLYIYSISFMKFHPLIIRLWLRTLHFFSVKPNIQPNKTESFDFTFRHNDCERAICLVPGSVCGCVVDYMLSWREQGTRSVASIDIGYTNVVPDLRFGPVHNFSFPHSVDLDTFRAEGEYRWVHI